MTPKTLLVSYFTKYGGDSDVMLNFPPLCKEKMLTSTTSTFFSGKLGRRNFVFLLDTCIVLFKNAMKIEDLKVVSFA